MTQIQVENNTPYRRRVFLHPMELSANEPVPLMLAAWKHFDLGPGESIGAALGALRIGARVTHGSVLDHRTVVAGANYGDTWTFALTNGIPTLSGGGDAMRGVANGIQVFNALDGPDAPAIELTFYWDYAPWIGFEVPPQRSAVFSFTNQLFAYASKPIAGDSSALVIEPVTGKFLLANEPVRLKLTPSADGAGIQWASGDGERIQ